MRSGSTTSPLLSVRATIEGYVSNRRSGVERRNTGRQARGHCRPLRRSAADRPHRARKIPSHLEPLAYVASWSACVHVCCFMCAHMCSHNWVETVPLFSSVHNMLGMPSARSHYFAPPHTIVSDADLLVGSGVCEPQCGGGAPEMYSGFPDTTLELYAAGRGVSMCVCCVGVLCACWRKVASSLRSGFRPLLALRRLLACSCSAPFCTYLGAVGLPDLRSHVLLRPFVYRSPAYAEPTPIACWSCLP